MLNSNDVANKLCQELKKYGTSELSYSKNVFTGKPSEQATIVSSINKKSFKVMMFDASRESGIPSASVHFSLNVTEMKLSQDQADFWNSDNRFTKIYRQDEGHTFLVFDSFFPSTGEDFFSESVVKIWSLAITELLKLKISCERRGIF